MRMKYLKSKKSTQCKFLTVHESNYLKSIIIPNIYIYIYISFLIWCIESLLKKKGVMRF